MPIGGFATTARFLLGNLHGFDPAEHLVPAKELLPLDQWAVQQAYDTQQAVRTAYSKYDFPDIVQRIQNFCTNEMGALYLDMTKDRLYTMQADSHGRRSAQSAMYRILEALVRWLAPILSFTAEEIWKFLPVRTARGPRGESVMLKHGMTVWMRRRARPSSARFGPICWQSGMSSESGSSNCAGRARSAPPWTPRWTCSFRTTG